MMLWPVIIDLSRPSRRTSLACQKSRRRRCVQARQVRTGLLNKVAMATELGRRNEEAAETRPWAGGEVKAAALQVAVVADKVERPWVRAARGASKRPVAAAWTKSRM